MRFAATVAILCLAAATGCQQEYIPIMPDGEGLRVPNQQLLLADAADQAFENIDLSMLSGKSVYVEAVGVLPHTPVDLLDYLIYRTELKLSQAGALVNRVTYTYSGEEGGAPIPGMGTYRTAIDVPENVDYRIVLAVRAAGADLQSFDNFLVQKEYIIGRVWVEVAAFPLRAGQSTYVEPVGEALQLGRGFGEKILMWDNTFLYLIPSPQVPYTGGTPTSFGQRVMNAMLGPQK